MIFGDNQTKHFYAMKSAEQAAVKDVVNSDLFRIEIPQGNRKVTTDVIDRKLIKRAVINEVKPTKFRQWVVTAPDTVTVGKTYHIYFYLENMIGFGMQDRWDRVASYTAETNNKQNLMKALQEDLDSKLNGAGPIKNDFTVTLQGNDIVVAENPNSATYAYNKMDILTHSNPYAYNVTMSTFDGDKPWTEKEIKATIGDDAEEYISAATKVLAMEMYFLRNRGDLYQLTKPFGVSIINDTNTDEKAETYYTLDIDYAFSDTQGYTYHSDKQLSIACPTKATLDSLLKKILKDSNSNSLGEVSEGE